MIPVFQLLRPHHWTKNLFCLAGVFFGGKALQFQYLDPALKVFLIYCLASSAVYAFNDILDVEADRLHPRKRHRPLASGGIGTTGAAVLSAVLAVCALGFASAMQEPAVFRTIVLYLVLNAAYSLGLKHIPIFDVGIIALGFILRVVGGSAGAGIQPTGWLVVCTFFLTLLLAVGKRRAEMGSPHFEAEIGRGPFHLRRREVLKGYTPRALDSFAAICAALVICFYSVFCLIGREERMLLLTIPPVVMGVFRFLLLTWEDAEAETPEFAVWKDPILRWSLVVWGCLYAAVIYTPLREMEF